MKKKTQRILTIILAVFVTVSMVGSAAFSFLYPGPNSTPASPSPTSSGSGSAAASTAASADAQYQLRKSQVQDLEQKAKAQPGDSSVEEQLANAYFDLGVAAQQSAPAEAVSDFTKSVQTYQETLKSKKDFNVLLDLATAAFYAGQDDLADKTYKEVLAQQPDSFDALYGYGLFLTQAKKDYAGAIKLWQLALAKDPANSNAAQLKQLIAQVEQLQTTK